MRKGGYVPSLEVGYGGLSDEMEEQRGVRGVEQGYQPKGGRELLCNWA